MAPSKPRHDTESVKMSKNLDIATEGDYNRSHLGQLRLSRERRGGAERRNGKGDGAVVVKGAVEARAEAQGGGDDRGQKQAFRVG